MMICANFKPLEYYMEEFVEYLEGVKCSETKNPPKRNNQNNNSSGLKKTKKAIVSVMRTKSPKKSEIAACTKRRATTVQAL
eukprot:13622470-Ditylum_brightwellii.AAC.1